MLSYRFNEDMFAVGANVLVNPVNCVGVMGAGLAKEFKERYPKNYRRYHLACKEGQVNIGKCYTTVNNMPGNLVIINLPTKTHWSSLSLLEWVEAGLRDMLDHVGPGDVVAIPGLGCGLGGLESASVMDVMLSVLSPVTDVQFIICVHTPNTGAILL